MGKTRRTQAGCERVIVYVDGFNLYYGLRAKGWRRYHWLDVRLLAQNLLRSSQSLAMVRYFTSPHVSFKQYGQVEATEDLPGSPGNPG